jgi:hypothetical protein
MPEFKTLPEDERPVEGAGYWVVAAVFIRTTSCGFADLF